MSETWYVMEDGSVGDPHKIALDKKGVLRHEDGRAVAYAPHGPRSRGCVDAVAERAKVSVMKGEKSPNQAREEIGLPPVQKEEKPEVPKRGYRTRESKAE